MSVDDETLMAFADGQLSASERAEVERALEADASLRAKLAVHERMRTRFSEAFDPTLHEPVPERLLAAARAKRSAEIVDLSARRASKWSVREWGAMAASLAAGLIIAFGLNQGQAGPFMIADGKLTARGELAQALDTRLAADASDAIHIGLSFRNAAGEYCRTFAVETADVAGLSCRDARAWRVAMTSAHTQTPGEIRTAGSETPPEILAAVEALIAGDVLGAEAEAAARDAEWRAPPP
jgi:hypothetical protein